MQGRVSVKMNLLCYLKNKYQVTRSNRRKDGREETLNLLIRLCFRDN